jgi:hypothetical protein
MSLIVKSEGTSLSRWQFASYGAPAMPLLWRYPLTEERLAEIQAEIASNKQRAIDNPEESAQQRPQTPAPQTG